MSISEQIREAIRKAECALANLETAKEDASATIAKSNRDIDTIKRNVKRMNVELIAAISKESAERKMQKKLAHDQDDRLFERQFVANARAMLSSATYKAILDASSVELKDAA